MNPGTLSSSWLSMYFSTMSVCVHDERGRGSVVCVCVHAHCVGRGRTHIASENVHVHVLVLLAVLEVVAMFSEKCFVQMAELVLCTHVCTTRINMISSACHGQASCVDACVYLAQCSGAPPRCGRRRHPLRCSRLPVRWPSWRAGSRLRSRSPVPLLRTSSEWKEETHDLD